MLVTSSWIRAYWRQVIRRVESLLFIIPDLSGTGMTDEEVLSDLTQGRD